MKKNICHYAIIRFLPYLETGEFANVGVVVSCPETGYFDYRLMTHISRITAFFEELNIGIYRRARVDFKNELDRIKQYLLQERISGCGGRDLDRHVFGELTRPREVMMRFDGARAVLADDPAQQLEELFAHYVGRNFATKAYQELMLEKNVRNVLTAAKLVKQYVPLTIGNPGSYHAKFPFVHSSAERPLKAIKPLHLAQDDPAQIYDHGWAWIGKIAKLRTLRTLPDEVLFPVQGPAEDSGERYDMYRDITEKMTAEGVLVVPAANRERIIQFAVVQ